ncbi:unnamed protein product [Symbiodinium natans]|uniref:Uncharacterized protein n=1 Tax=Symbiodinium natans TaxID=878477 RepID=A0A812UJ42_9DINO|nr:unnamed protein product [Symbiodinium natans]
MVTAAGGDSRLQQILQTRLLRSEGAENNHCFTKEPSKGSADAGCKPASLSPPQDKTLEDASVGKLFCMHSGDTPPPTPRTGSDHFPCPGEAAKQGSEDEAESTDGLPDSQEVMDGDLSHYDWQFELMNSMPREKALELARVLKRSEKEKVLESAKLRQEVVELKRQVNRNIKFMLRLGCVMCCDANAGHLRVQQSASQSLMSKVPVATCDTPSELAANW